MQAACSNSRRTASQHDFQGLKIKNAADKTETVSHLAILLMAWLCRDVKSNIWEAKHADIDRLTAGSIIEQAPSLTDGEKIEGN